MFSLLQLMKTNVVSDTTYLLVLTRTLGDPAPIETIVSKRYMKEIEILMITIREGGHSLPLLRNDGKKIRRARPHSQAPENHPDIFG